MYNLDMVKHPALDKQAVARDKRYVRWVGIKSGSSNRRYLCRLCGMQIDAESARHPMTKHAYHAILAHREVHLKLIGDYSLRQG